MTVKASELLQFCCYTQNSPHRTFYFEYIFFYNPVDNETCAFSHKQEKFFSFSIHSRCYYYVSRDLNATKFKKEKKIGVSVVTTKSLPHFIWFYLVFLHERTAKKIEHSQHIYENLFIFIEFYKILSARCIDTHGISWNGNILISKFFFFHFFWKWEKCVWECVNIPTPINNVSVYACVFLSHTIWIVIFLVNLIRKWFPHTIVVCLWIVSIRDTLTALLVVVLLLLVLMIQIFLQMWWILEVH